MAELKWNDQDSRRYISGVSNGVFYGDDGKGIPWNGLISVTEKHSVNEPTPVYNSLGQKYDLHGNVAEKTHALVCFMYPEEMDEYLGYEYLDEFGFHVDERPPKKFNMVYRNDADGYYEIHVLLGLIATFGDKAHTTDAAAPGIANISMNLQGVPHEVYGSSHLIFDSRNPITESVERILFGTEYVDPNFDTLLTTEVGWVNKATNYAPIIEPDYDNYVTIGDRQVPGIKGSSKWNQNNLIVYWDVDRECMALHSLAYVGEMSRLSIPLPVETPLDLMTSVEMDFGEWVYAGHTPSTSLTPGMDVLLVGGEDVESGGFNRRIIGTRNPQVLSPKAPSKRGTHKLNLRSTISEDPYLDIYHKGPSGSPDVYVYKPMVTLQNYRHDFFDANTPPQSRGERYRRVESDVGYYTAHEHLQFESQAQIEIILIGENIFQLRGPDSQLSVDTDEFTFDGPQAGVIDDIFSISDGI